MNNQEAAIILSTAMMQMDWEKPEMKITHEVLLRGLKALEKQIPQGFIQNGLFITCPRCGTLILPTKHCPECGQRLKWEEVG